MDVKFFFIAVMILNGYPVQGISIFSLIHDLLQDNVAGRPVIHEVTDWDFDPDVGKIRRVQFEALNGWQGRDLIDRLGYGIGSKGVTPKTISVNKPAVILSSQETPAPENHQPQP